MAVAIAVLLSPAVVHAQSTVITINTSSASVYKSPSTGSIVIGTARRGAKLEVTRELGSWVKVSWPAVQDGVGYVHVTMGTIARNVTPELPRATPGRAATTAPERTPVSSAHADTAAVARKLTPASPVNVSPVSHVVGVGGRMGAGLADSPTGFGVTARGWRRSRLGLQLDVSRYALTSSFATERLTSVQFEPSVLYALPNVVTDYVWVRPYVGSGVSLRRQTLTSGPSGAAFSTSESGMGVQTFGGGEFTFASMPQFTLSTDLAYRWSRTEVPGFELGGLGVALSAHWYLK
jgi:hypothetical protein